MNPLLAFCAGFTACSLLIVAYMAVKAKIAKIEQDRIQRAKRTPILPIQVFKASNKRILFPPDYAVKEQGDWRVQP